MGLFDTVYCEYPLPEGADGTRPFQTKDFECLLDTYLITEEGRPPQAVPGGLLHAPRPDALRRESVVPLSRDRGRQPVRCWTSSLIA